MHIAKPIVAPLAISDPVRIDRDDLHLVKHRWLNTIPIDICACLWANSDATPVLADRELAVNLQQSNTTQLIIIPHIVAK